MSLLQPDNAVYHHPLDTVTETIKSQPWTQSGGDFAAGKVSNALAGTAGDSLNAFGTETEFQSAGGATWNSAAMLSATSFVMVYRDGGDGNGTAKIGTVGGTDITFGAEVEFLGGAAISNSVAALSTTSFVVVYRDGSSFGHGTAKIGTVSGTNITFSAEAEFLGANGANYTSAAALSATSFVVAYRDESDNSKGTAKIGTVSGTDIAFGVETEFRSTNGAAWISVAALSATSFVVAYRDDADNGNGTARIGTVSGTDIAFGAEAEFLSLNGALYNSVAALSATSFVVAYRDNADGSKGTAKIGTVSGTDIAFGAEAEFLSADGAYYNSVAALSATSFVVAYTDGADGNKGTARVGTVSGTDITFGAEAEFQSAGTTSYISAAALSATSFAVAYTDGADGSNGTAKVGTLPAGASLTGTGASYDSVVGSTKLAYTGWLKNPSE